LLLLAAAPAAAEEVLRIAVAERLPGPVEVRGEGLRARPLVDDGSYAEVEGGAARLTRGGDGVVLDGVPTGAVAVKLRADGPIGAAGKTLRGSLEVLLDEEGGLLVVNELPVEEYLAAVLGSEMPPGFPPEALKAQAVAARTYAVRKKFEGEGRPFHLGATVLSQVYGGVHREDPRTRAAVEATAGEVLVFDHEPIEAYFFSSCGGRTADGEEALGRPLPYLTSVACPERASVPGARWNLELSAAELGRRLGTGPVERLGVESRTGTGRVRAVRVKARGGQERTLTGAELRQRVGYTALGSLAFEVTGKGRGFRFEGRGTGHGAGLCQWGARAAAEDGWDYRRILSHYYRGAAIRQMY
jgi:stage II sporulation protein D